MRSLWAAVLVGTAVQLGGMIGGVGQRMFLVGSEGQSIMEFQEIVFETPEEEHGEAAG